MATDVHLIGTFSYVILTSFHMLNFLLSNYLFLKKIQIALTGYSSLAWKSMGKVTGEVYQGTLW